MEIIRKNKPKLIKWLSSDYLILLQHVQSNDFVTMLQYQDLKERKAQDGVITLLDIIIGRGKDECRRFLNMLKDDDVNEMSPELRKWSEKINVEDLNTEEDNGRASLNMPIEETTKGSGPSGTQVKCTISATDGGSVNAPIITGSKMGPFVMNTTAPHPAVPRNYQKPARDCEHRPIQDYQKFLKENTSLLVQKVKNLGPIIDDLDLHDELVANVRANRTDQDKMRKLLTCVNCESIAKNLVDALWRHEKGLMNELQNSY